MADTVSVMSSLTAISVKSTKHDDELHRAVHRVRLSALEHNFRCVEAAAIGQRCSVITVVKADGYGHGAIATALHLSDCCGAGAFAVATLEEAIQLRRAFEQNPPGRWSPQLASHFHVAHDSTHPAYWAASAASNATSHAASSSNSVRVGSAPQLLAENSLRPDRIRILVLGPPVGFPRSFDDYHYHGIEVMVSGPEVAEQLLVWVKGEKERRETEVARAANESMAQALIQPRKAREEATQKPASKASGDSIPTTVTLNPTPPKKVLQHPSSTLGNVSGQDLANEVRALLITQQAAKEKKVKEKEKTELAKAPPSPATPVGRIPTVPSVCSMEDTATGVGTTSTQHSSGSKGSDSSTRKLLRWHALVDSGMGRAGFKTHRPEREETRRDTVEILKELVDRETNGNAPIQFYGMCTHMADANSTSTYTSAQIDRFMSLLNRVREAGISVPTISTDNSAALLTTNLTHFKPESILTQPGKGDSLGFVRVGGAIYGQRPAFQQLQPVSTLCASVRHVAVLQEGDSVGYDRAYVAPHAVRIATLTIGFADGYPRALGNGVGKVNIRDEVYPVAGNVCMDMLMVDLGPADDSRGADVAVGDIATLWGREEGMVKLEELSDVLKTTQSSLTCGLDKIRVRRVFE